MTKKKSASSARGARAAKNAGRTKRRIDFSDIPEASPAQLARMRRVGRPTIGDTARQLIAIRIDPHVLEQLREEAKERRMGYQTLVNEILAQHVKKAVA